jgi:decaprenyl-phosphate phosphoribosyltransferase
VRRDIVGLLRPDHWFKNVFAIPGAIAAMALFRDDFDVAALLWRVPLGAVALCLTASANYVLNAILDASPDAHHPTKRNRALPSGRVSPRLAWSLYAITTAAGLGLGLLLGWRFAASLLALWVMGLVYNVPPIRSKDVAYLDVLSESANNPIRLMAGWWIVLPTGPIPPGSLILAYWMGGGFLMALKRFGELRFIGDRAAAARYRRSFAHYDEPTLLASVLFYACMASAFLATFCVRYRLELLLSLPFAVFAMALYFTSAFREDSPVQRPEHLWREPLLVGCVVVFVIVFTVLLFVDLPFLDDWMSPSAPNITGVVSAVLGR